MSSNVVKALLFGGFGGFLLGILAGVDLQKLRQPTAVQTAVQAAEPFSPDDAHRYLAGLSQIVDGPQIGTVKLPGGEKCPNQRIIGPFGFWAQIEVSVEPPYDIERMTSAIVRSWYSLRIPSIDVGDDWLKNSIRDVTARVEKAESGLLVSGEPLRSGPWEIKVAVTKQVLSGFGTGKPMGIIDISIPDLFKASSPETSHPDKPSSPSSTR